MRDADDDADARSRRSLDRQPPLPLFAWLVTRDANRTVGSGMASIELLRRTLGRRGWIDDEEHGLLIAVSRVTPGTNMLAYLAALGWTHHRTAGAALAVAAGSLPGAAVVTVLTAAAASLDRWPAARAVLAVATLVAGALVLANAWALLRPHVRGPRVVWTVASIALAAALAFAGATPVRVLLVLAVWGALTASEATPRRDKHVAPPR